MILNKKKNQILLLRWRKSNVSPESNWWQVIDFNSITMINWECGWNSPEVLKMNWGSEPCQNLSIQVNARIFYYWTQPRHSFSHHQSLYNQEQAQHSTYRAVSVKVVLCIVKEPHFFQTGLFNIFFYHLQSSPGVILVYLLVLISF